MCPQRQACRREGTGASRQFREKRQHFRAGRLLKRVHCPFGWLEAFGPGPLGLHDLVPVEKDVDLRHALGRQGPRHFGQADQVLGRNQDLAFAEIHLGPDARDQDAVLR